MSVFGAYSRYYDFLYRDKDYEGEANYISSLAHKFAPGSVSLLDIGCGTGRHIELLSKMGFSLAGVDRSEFMVSRARLRNPGIEIHNGDLCDIRLDKKFDVVSALFHVVSYQTTDSALKSAFQTVKEHLKLGGLFIFDCWHGPAVLHQQPEVRVKRLQGATARVVRIAEPDMMELENRVDVNYQIFVEENAVWHEFTETHSMRYLFVQEIEELLSQSGLQLLHSEEWLTAEKPSENSWSVVYIARLN